MPSVFENVACTRCGCACDDLRITTDAGRVVTAERACALAEPCYLGQRAMSAVRSNWKAKLDAAAAILNASRCPLVYGLMRPNTDGHRAAVALADKIGAVLDTAGSHAATVALQQVGESTCTLGEVKHRADLVIFWRADPLATHPRFLERYCPPRPGRTILVVDEVETATAEAADTFVKLAPGADWDALWNLRLLVAGKGRTFAASETSGSGEPTRPLVSLAANALAARFGVIVFGSDLTEHRTVEALFQLVADLNDHPDPATRRRFYAIQLKPETAGAESVLAWQTGYPFGVSFAPGFPRHHPGETTGPEMLARGEPDACVLVGGDAVKHLPPAALDHLRRIPVILLDPPGVPPPVPVTVRFEVAVPGVHCPGTATRLDGVTLPLRPLLPSGLPTDADVLAGLLERVEGRY